MRTACVRGMQRETATPQEGFPCQCGSAESPLPQMLPVFAAVP